MTLATALSAAQVDAVAQALLDAGRTQQSRLQPVAQSLVGSLVLLQMSWFGIQALLESLIGEQLGLVLARLFRYVLLVGLTEWLLADFDQVFYQALYGGTTVVVQAVAGSTGETQSFASAWNVFLDLILALSHTMLTAPANYTAGFSLLQPGSWVGPALGVIALEVILGAMILVFVVGMIIVAAIHVVGAAMVGLGLSLGPLFIPWLLLDTTRSVFSGWVRFLLTACLYRVVAVAVLQLVRPVFLNLQGLAANGGDPGQALGLPDALIDCVMLSVLTFLITDLMARVPQLAAALMGHARVDTGTIGNVARPVGELQHRMLTLGGGKR